MKSLSNGLRAGAFFATLTCVWCAPLEALSLARWLEGDTAANPTKNPVLPKRTLNAIVGVELNFETQTTEVTRLGTGTIIGIRRNDPQNERKGGAICVLTADHVVRPRQDARRSRWRIGFVRDDGMMSLITGDKSRYIQGPTVDGKPVDLAILAFSFENFIILPELLEPLPKIGGVAEDLFYQAGYGHSGRVTNTIDPFYNVVSEYGKLAIGFNDPDAIEPVHTTPPGKTNGVAYTYQAIQGDLDFKLGNDRPNVVSGQSHFLNSDSGGPSLQQLGDDWLVVGVHSESETRVSDGNMIVRPGDKWWDVQTARYQQWISDTCRAALAIPEPSGCSLLSASLLALAAQRCANQRRGRIG